MAASIQIKDSFLVDRVERERRKVGESTIVRTATRLLTERLSQLEYERRIVPVKAQSPANCRNAS